MSKWLRWLSAVIAVFPITAFAATIQLMMVSSGNDVGVTSLRLYTDKTFVIVVELMEQDDTDGARYEYRGSFKEWENVYDLHFEQVCRAKKCSPISTSTVEELFVNSMESGPLKNDARTIRINKNPKRLFIHNMLMEPTETEKAE